MNVITKLTIRQEEQILKEIAINKNAYSKLYQAYINDIYRYVKMIVKDVHKTEDIVSQTILSGFEHIDQFVYRGISIKYWFLKIARNYIFLNNKKDSYTLPLDMGSTNITDYENFEQQIINQELISLIKSAILKLDDKTREVLSLRIWEEMKFEDISTFMDMNLSTVKMRYKRGIEKLSAILNKHKYSGHISTILSGYIALKALQEYIPSLHLLGILSSNINNIIISGTIMNTIPGVVSHSTVASTLTAKFFYPIIASVGVVTLSVGAVTGNYLSNINNKNNQTQSSTITISTTSTNKATSFSKSSTITTSFSYSAGTYDCIYKDIEIKDGESFTDYANCRYIECNKGNIMSTLIGDCTPSSSSYSSSTYTIPEISYKELCENNGGQWHSTYNECDFIDINTCTSNHGVYNECTPPYECRMNPEMQCLEVCIPACFFQQH